MKRLARLAPLLLVLAWLSIPDAAGQTDPLASWNPGPVKQVIVAFVRTVTRTGGPNYVSPAERIAVFDNDGTLWAEQPIYFQFAFALDRIKVLAPQHPEWQQQQPFKAALEGDHHAVMAAGEKGLVQVIEVSHAGMTTDDFARTVAEWMKTARHPVLNRPYDSLVYKPMLELLVCLRANGFKTFIVSGGGVEFMRVFAERAYGIPSEQVVGSSGVTKFQMGADGKPALMTERGVECIDDGPGKPVGINRFIGRRPILAFGNFGGDQHMLQWTAAGPGLRFMGIGHHTDAQREYAYDRQSEVGRLDKALDEAQQRGWTIVDMKRDWKTVFP